MGPAAVGAVHLPGWAESVRWGVVGGDRGVVEDVCVLGGVFNDRLYRVLAVGDGRGVPADRVGDACGAREEVFVGALR
jgi:hypothetical protein